MNKNLVLVSLSLMVWGLGEGMFFFFQAPYLEQMGANSLEIGQILGLVSAAMAITHLPAGYLSDRIGRRPMLISAWFTGLISTIIMAASGNIRFFVVGAVLYGFTAFVSTPLSSYITAARGKQSVARALTLVSATYNLGAILGPWLGGIIGEKFGLRSNYIVAAGLFVISTTLILLIQPQPVEPRPVNSDSTFKNSLLNFRFFLFLGLLFFAMLSMILPQPFSQLFLLNQGNQNLEEVGRLLSLSSLGVVILNIVLGKLNPRTGFLLAQIAVGFFTFLMFKGNQFIWYAIGYFFLGSYRTARSLATAQGRDLVPVTDMGIAYGFIETMAALANILAPLIASYLYNRNPVSIYSISLVLIIISAVLMYFFSPLRNQTIVIDQQEV